MCLSNYIIDALEKCFQNSFYSQVIYLCKLCSQIQNIGYWLMELSAAVFIQRQIQSFLRLCL